MTTCSMIHTHMSVCVCVCVCSETRRAQSVWWLTTDCTVLGSNPGGGEIFRTCPNRPWTPPSLLYNGYRVSFPEVKRQGAWRWLPTLSRAEVNTPSWFSWPFLGWTFINTWPSFRETCSVHSVKWFVPDERGGRQLWSVAKCAYLPDYTQHIPKTNFTVIVVRSSKPIRKVPKPISWMANLTLKFHHSSLLRAP